MKLKLLTLAAILACAAAAQAGPSIFVSFGSGGACNQRPAYYCPPRPVCQPYYYQAPVVYYNRVPVCYGGTRFSNVSGFVTGRQGVVQVARPVYPVQPVNVYRGNSFRWR